MRPSKALAALVSLCLVLGAAACGGQREESEDDIVADIAETLRSGPQELDEREAECFAKIVVDEIGLEEARDIKVSDSEPSDEQQLAIAKATVRAQDECDLGGSG